MDLYRQQILDHYKHPHNFGHLESPDSSVTLYNTACGDKITIEVHVEKKGKKVFVTDIAFHGEGCAVSMASASMLTDDVKHKEKHEILALEKKDIMQYFEEELTPSRTKCALLPLEVLQKCIQHVA